MISTAEIYALIEARREDLGMSQADVGLAAIGQPNSSVIQSIKRGSSPSADKLQLIADALGFEFHFGPRRAQTVSALHVADDTDFIKVPRYNVALSAGPGGNGDNAEMSAPLAFRADWMRDRGLRADDCVVVNVSGDSMAPALLDNDLVLIDRTERPIRNMDIYAFVDGDSLASVKRFEKGAEHLIIRSDNPAFQTVVKSQQDADALTIIGRVVWSGREVGG